MIKSCETNGILFQLQFIIKESKNIGFQNVKSSTLVSIFDDKFKSLELMILPQKKNLLSHISYFLPKSDWELTLPNSSLTLLMETGANSYINLARLIATTKNESRSWQNALPSAPLAKLSDDDSNVVL